MNMRQVAFPDKTADRWLFSLSASQRRTHHWRAGPSRCQLHWIVPQKCRAQPDVHWGETFVNRKRSWKYWSANVPMKSVMGIICSPSLT